MPYCWSTDILTEVRTIFCKLKILLFFMILFKNYSPFCLLPLIHHVDEICVGAFHFPLVFFALFFQDFITYCSAGVIFPGQSRQSYLLNWNTQLEAGFELASTTVCILFPACSMSIYI